MNVSKQIHIGPVHAALIADRRQRRIVLRTWRTDRPDRSGRWVVSSLAPPRLITGREFPAAELA